ncbi:MAG: class I SAM-dependent methyltransferase [Bacteroidota bacterium]
MPDLDLLQRYYLDSASAFVRGKFPATVPFGDIPLDQLSFEQLETIFIFGREQGLKMHKFKRTMELPRVNKVIGILTGLQPSNLLDIGTGRGVFLWPFLDRNKYTPVTCIDMLDYRVDDLTAVKDGGINRISAHLMSVTDLAFENDQFDVVTALEVIEHIPDHRKAVVEVCRVANQFAIITVPSKEDDNPEHLSVLDQGWFTNTLNDLGYPKIKFDYVLNHLIVVVNLR